MPPLLRSLLLAAALVPSATGAAAQPPATLSTDRVEGLVRPLVARHDFSGAVAITQGGRVLLSNTWGKADIASARPFGATTRFHLGPLSQQFTAVLILDLAADGYLTIDDQLSRWLPGIRWAELVTIRDLLGHRGGLPRDFPTLPTGEERFTTDSDRFGWLSTVPQVGGRPYAFSNVGYWLLAQVAARAGESPFPALLRSRVFEPNGLRSIEIDDGAHPIADLATGYEPSGMTEVVPRAPKVTGGQLGASGLVASVADLITWTNALHGGRIIPRPLVDAMIDGRWGGLEDTVRGGRRAVGRAGTGPGYAVSADWYPLDKVVVLVFGNVRSGAAEQLRDALPASVFGGTAPAISRPAAGQAPQAAWLPDYVGSYRDSAGRHIVVQQTGTGLQLGITGDAPTDIYPLGSEAYFQRATYARIEFVRDAGGKVRTARWIRNGTSAEFTRE